MRSREDIRLDLAAGVLRTFGGLRFRAYGGSMLPAICPGDVLIAGRESMSEIRRGHVVLFRRDGRFFAHRVVRIGIAHQEDRGNRRGLITKGDALAGEDAVVSEEEFLGRVSAVLRNRSTLELPLQPCLGERLLAWAFQRSDFLAGSFLRWRVLCARFVQRSSASVPVDREAATENV